MYPLTIDGFCKVNKPSPGKCRGMAIFRRKKKYSAVNWCLKESNAHRPYCRGGIHASRVHGAFSPNGAKKRDVSPPGGINASPTVFFATFPKQPDKHQFITLPGYPTRQPYFVSQLKKGAKIPRQSSLRLWLRSAAIHFYERLLQNGAQTQGPHPHPFFAPYSVSYQQSPEQS